jgi:Family of unknown function (DUF6496)
MAKYSKAAQQKIKSVMDEKKKGTLKTGSGKKVTDQKQAVAIALSEAREEDYKVPSEKKTATKKAASKKAPPKETAKKK